jgi:two-component system response regulator GlrR
VSQGQTTDQSTNGSVLVAEEDSDLRDIIAAFLEAKGWHVVASAMGSGAPARPRLDRFVVVVLDIRSFASAAFKMLEELRANEPALPVIVIASFGDVFVSRHAKKLGAANVLEKPFDLEDLEQALAKLNLVA